jgi:hypothetical protein
LAMQRPPGVDQLRLECGALAGQLLRHAPEDIAYRRSGRISLREQTGER